MKLHRFKNKVVWVTGAASGIGYEMAHILANHQARLVISDRNEQDLIRFKTDKKLSDQQCLIIPFDLTKMNGISNKVKQVVDHYQQIDYLINNAGISQRSFCYETGLEVDRKVIETNFFGTITLTKAVLPVMLKQGFGHLSATSSLVGKFGFPLRSAYSASKHALHGFFESMRTEVHGKGIKVAMIIPGRTLTQISMNAITKDGSNYGSLDKGQAKGMKADVAAQRILNGIAKGKKEVLVGGKDIWMVYIRRFSPPLYYYLSSKVSPT